MMAKTTRYEGGIVRLFAMVVGLLAFGWGAEGFAGESEMRAEALSKQGIELRRAGKDSDAIPRFKQAYELAASPKNAGQYGLCLLALSRWTDADFFLTEAIVAKDDPWIKKNRSVLKDASETAKSHIGRVEILGSPDGAKVIVSGRSVGAFPLNSDIPVNEGSVDIEVSADGYAENTRTLSVAGASHQSVVIRLAPSLSKPSLAVASMASEGVSQSAIANKPEDPPSVLRSPWLWAGVGVIVAAIGGSILVTSGGMSYPHPDQKGGWQQ